MYLNAVGGRLSHSDRQRAKKLARLSRVVLKLCDWTGKQTNSRTSLSSQEQSKNFHHPFVVTAGDAEEVEGQRCGVGGKQG